MQPISPDLVLRAQQGDATAQQHLLAGLQDVLRRYFARRIGPRDEVNDLIQNTLLRVHTGLPSLQQPDRLQAFAMKAALYELQDFYRGRYSSREMLYDPDIPPERPVAPPAGERLDAERLLGTLSDHARRILELRGYGYRYEEIAETLGTTEAAVKMQVKRALDKLRDFAAVLVPLGTLLAAFAHANL